MPQNITHNRQKWFDHKHQIWHLQGSVVTVGNNIIWAGDGNQMGGGSAFQNAAQNNDQFKTPVRLPEGFLTLTLVVVKFNNGGQIQLDLQAPGGATVTNIGTVDFYNATVLYNQFVQFGFGVTAGEYQLYSQVTGKNASSAGFQVRITFFDFLVV